MLKCDRETRAYANDVAASEWLELVKADEGNPLVTGANPFAGLSREELRRELDTRRDRRKAQEAIKAALDVEDDRRVAACAVKLCASTFEDAPAQALHVAVAGCRGQRYEIGADGE